MEIAGLTHEWRTTGEVEEGRKIRKQSKILVAVVGLVLVVAGRSSSLVELWAAESLGKGGRAAILGLAESINGFG